MRIAATIEPVDEDVPVAEGDAQDDAVDEEVPPPPAPHPEA